MKRFLLAGVSSLLLATATTQTALSQCADTLSKLIGFTIGAASPVYEEQNQPGGKIIQLDNGMQFFVQARPKESFSHGPTVIVFYRQISQFPAPVVENRLLIEDEIYMCRRLK